MAKSSRKKILAELSEPYERKLMDDPDDPGSLPEKEINPNEGKIYLIKDAAIKDDFCNYSYEIISGIGVGDTHGVKGKAGIIDDDMRNAFAVFNVHLAYMAGIFKYSKIKITDIDLMHGHEITGLVQVTGFKIKGSEENESIIIIGDMYCSEIGGRMDLTTPPVPLDNLSSYKWYNELKQAADKARTEVELYKEGKYTPVQPEEPKDDAVQTKISFEASDTDFEKAKV